MLHKQKKSPQRHFYGATTLGEKGQIVIPKEARKSMDLSKGDHLLVFGLHDGMLAIAKLAHVEEIASHFSQMLKEGHAHNKEK